MPKKLRQYHVVVIARNGDVTRMTAYPTDHATAVRLAGKLNQTHNRRIALEEVYKKNPAPAPAERSAKFHRLRAALLTKLSIASRKGSAALKAEISRKLLKLDRMFYAPRNIKRRK